MQALSDPRIALPLLGVSVGLGITNWFTARYGGYAGQISAETALSLLEDENAALIDIR